MNSCTAAPIIRKLWPLAAFALIALIGVGCGSGASSGDGAAGSSSASTDQAQGVKFAECIRANGITDFPDPEPNGDFAYGASVTPAEFNEALSHCKDLQPPGALSSKRTPEEQDSSLKFAECIRENGVRDFPDPVNGEPVINTYKIPSSNQPGGMTILNAAIAKCKDLVAEASGGQP